MPFFKSNANIFKDHKEYFESRWMDDNKIHLPPTKNWTYDREISIEDIELWEVLHESSFGIYAAWLPKAEFYMISPFYMKMSEGYQIETFSGIDASVKTYDRAKELGINLPLNNYWIDDEVYVKIKKN